jgi:hypothetical protein
VSGQPVCPECGATVENHWEWCHNCGFDPDRKRPAGASLLSSASTAAPLATAASGLLDAAPAFDAAAPFDTAPPFEAPAPFDAGEPFDPNALFDPAPPAPAASAPVAPAPSFGDTFDPFNAPVPGSFAPDAGGEGGAFDALQSLTGPPSALAGWDSAPPAPFPAPPPGAPAPGFSPGPGFGPAAPPSFGAAPAPGGFPAHHPQGSRPGFAPSAGMGRRLTTAVGVVLAVVLVGVLGVGAVTFIGTTAPTKPTPTTLDPSAPPPIGQLPLGGRSADTETDSSPEPELFPGWQTYRPSDGTFTANFPSAPQVDRLPLAGASQSGVQVMVKTAEAEYSVVYVDGISLEQWSMAGAGWHPTGSFEVAPGLVGTAFASDPQPGGQVLKGFVFGRPDRLYVVGAMGVSDADFHAFIHGFRWVRDAD